MSPAAPAQGSCSCKPCKLLSLPLLLLCSWTPLLLQAPEPANLLLLCSCGLMQSPTQGSCSCKAPAGSRKLLHKAHAPARLLLAHASSDTRVMLASAPAQGSRWLLQAPTQASCSCKAPAGSCKAPTQGSCSCKAPAGSCKLLHKAPTTLLAHVPVTRCPPHLLIHPPLADG